MDLPLTIGIDAREAFRAQPRGVGLYSRHLIRALGELLPQHRFVCYHERELPAGLQLPGNVEPAQHRMRGSRWHLWERLQMPWRIRRDAVALYHGMFNTLPPRWPVWRGPPMVVSLHDVIVTWLDANLDDPYVRYARAVTQRVVDQASAIMTVSEWSKREIIERFGPPADKIVVAYNGIDPGFLIDPPLDRTERVVRDYVDGRPYLFAIGAELERKNLSRMVEALGRIHARRPLEHAVLISGLSKAARQRIGEVANRHGLRSLVHFLPYLDTDDLIAVYAGADLMIYPSLVEGWGVPIIEALATGTPVVTSNTSGMREAAGEHATTFDPTDVESMSTAIETALANRADFAGIRDAAMARARGFTWRRHAELTWATYAGVL